MLYGVWVMLMPWTLVLLLVMADARWLMHLLHLSY